MRILIATGIFEPEAGGPAQYSKRLASELSKEGYAVTLVTYSDLGRYDFDSDYPFRLIRIVRKSGTMGKILNRIRFFFKILPLVRQSDVIYSLDWFAVGVPLSIAARLLRRPYVVRVGGDYAWEQVYLQSGEPPITLSDFYERGVYRKGIYGAIYRAIRPVLTGAEHVIFNSDIQREMYKTHYGLTAEKISTIYNAKPDIDPSIKRESASNEIVFWGRFIVMKNVATLIKAFAKAQLPETYHLTLIGDGPEQISLYEIVRDLGLEKRVSILHTMRWQAALERIKNCRAFVLPSWTDISPVQVYEALALRLPALVTKENYLPIRDQLPEMIDPTSPDDVAQKLQMLADEEKYTSFAKRFRDISYDVDWNAIVKAHRDLFGSVTGLLHDGVRVLQIGADRSKRGILFPESAASRRQKAYGEHLDRLDVIGLSLRSDGAQEHELSKTVHVYPTNSFSKIMWGLDAMRIARRLPRPDVISAQDPFETGLLASLMAAFKGVPLHVQIHTDFLSPAYRGLSVINSIRVYIAGFVLRRAERIRVVSAKIKSSVETTLGIKAPITVLPIFADIDRFKKAKVSEEVEEEYKKFDTKLLVVSRLEPEKNVSLAIRAFAEVSPENSCLIVVGNGSEKEILGDLAKQLGMLGRVFFVDPEDVAPYFALADLILVPSRYEGYGLVIVEALGMGKPVLSTDVGIAKESGAIIATPARFAEALSEWHKNGPKKMELASYPYESFEEYVQAYCDDIAATAQKGLNSLPK